MRLIGTVESEKKAFVVYSVLLEEGIHSTYERQFDQNANQENIAIWIYEEDQIDRAMTILEDFKQNPSDPRFAKIEPPLAPPQPPDTIAENAAIPKQNEESISPWKRRIKETPRKAKTYPITYLVVLICTFLFMWNGAQQLKMIKHDGKLALTLGLTPIQQDLMFDYPESNQRVNALLDKHSLKGVKDLKELPADEISAFNQVSRIPNFQGFLPYLIYWMKNTPPPESLDGPLFTKIREGEVWRIFTPCLLHAGILHILFNMAWAWLLIKQVEQRLPKWKTVLLMVLIGIVANVAQYLVSGPYFLGFSGIVVGLVGFIWVRQRVAPWEGYPLQKSTVLFIFIFVIAMSALEVFSLVTAAITAKEISANIANTAHIIGGLTGALLGKVPFFSRGGK